jgi:hypothetical protein
MGRRAAPRREGQDGPARIDAAVPSRCPVERHPVAWCRRDLPGRGERLPLRPVPDPGLLAQGSTVSTSAGTARRPSGARTIATPTPSTSTPSTIAARPSPASTPRASKLEATGSRASSTRQRAGAARRTASSSSSITASSGSTSPPPSQQRRGGNLRTWERLSVGKLKVFRTLRTGGRSTAFYRRDEKGAVVKKNDHLMDGTRYLMLSGMKRAKVRPIDKNTVMQPAVADTGMGY